MIGGLVLAAGGGRRFGGAKQLAELDGVPLLEHAIRALEAVPALERIVVVLGARAEEIRARVDFGRAEPRVCEGWAEGQAASLRAGVAALAEDDACVAALVALGDQPRLCPEVIEAVLDAFDRARHAAVRATYDGVPAHPTLLSRRLFPALARLRGDVGARDLLGTVPVCHVECAHLCRPDDVDTPDQLEAMRT